MTAVARRRVRVAALLLAVIVLLANKTPTACKGPPGDTGGGGWRASAQLCYGCVPR